MHLKRSIGLAVLVAAACAVLIGTAGAASGPQGHRSQMHFTSAAGVIGYLKAHGIPTRGIVIQRGHHNYAGPSCPGRRWHCTKARRVIQFDAGSGSNQFTCSPSYGGVGSSTPPDQCVIVQVSTSGNNSATCTENSSAPGESENCMVTQTSTTGNNKSKITQVIDQRDGQSQSASQTATVSQMSGTGRNDSDLSQTITQHMADGSSTVDQNQKGTQSNSVTQNSTSGTQNSSMSQSTKQLEHAGGGDDASMSLFAATPDSSASPVSGDQNQVGDGSSDTYQTSAGVSTSSNDQSMQQRELAPNGSTVAQFQNGPFRCCSPQSGNPKDTFTLKQSKLQFASTLPTSNQASVFASCVECPTGQFISESGFLESDGSVSINQTANQNGNQTNNSCSSTGACTASIDCSDGACVPFECSGFECGGFSLARYSAPAMALRPTLRLNRRTHHF